MKNLSKKIVVLALLLGSLGIYSCKKETGPKGDPGVNGTNGNANVTQISFGSKTVSFGSSLVLTLPGITKLIADKSLILTYGHSPSSTVWFSMNGTFENRSAPPKTFYSYINDGQEPVGLQISMIGNTTSETFAAIRVLVIPANVFVNGRSATPPFDINDYESVRQYFNLPK